MPLDDAPGDRQAQAGAAARRLRHLHEGFEDARQILAGIAREYLSRIFEPFVQVPQAPGGGARLGLAISRRIVEGHHGRLTVQSEPGRGSTFTFTVPVAAERRTA